MRKETVRRLGLLLFSVAVALLFCCLSAVREGQERTELSSLIAAAVLRAYEGGIPESE